MFSESKLFKALGSEQVREEFFRLGLRISARPACVAGSSILDIPVHPHRVRHNFFGLLCTPVVPDMFNSPVVVTNIRLGLTKSGIPDLLVETTSPQGYCSPVTALESSQECYKPRWLTTSRFSDSFQKAVLSAARQEKL